MFSCTCILQLDTQSSLLLAALHTHRDDASSNRARIARTTQGSRQLLLSGMTLGYSYKRPNVEMTGAARLYRAASSDRRERGRS